MGEDFNKTSDDRGISRRAAVGKLAAGGAVAWSAPVLLSKVAHASGSSDVPTEPECIVIEWLGINAWRSSFQAPLPEWADDPGEQFFIIAVVVGGYIQQELINPPLGTLFEVCVGESVIVRPFEPSEGGGGESGAPGFAAAAATDESTETTEAPAPETTAAPAPETTAAPAPETTEAPAPETTEAPEKTIPEEEPPAEPVRIFFDWGADSAMSEGDRIGPFEIVEVTEVPVGT